MYLTDNFFQTKHEKFVKKLNQLSIPISSSRCSAYLRTQGLRNHSSGLVSMHLGRQSQGLALPYHSVFPSDTHRNTRPCRRQPWIITSFKFPDEDLSQQLCDCELWWLQQSLSPCSASPEGKQSASLLLLPYTCARALISLNRPEVHGLFILAFPWADEMRRNSKITSPAFYIGTGKLLQ